MTGDEERLFRLILNETGEGNQATQENKRYMFDVYVMVTGRNWHYDYFTWYLSEAANHDTRGQGQIEGEESIR